MKLKKKGLRPGLENMSTYLRIIYPNFSKFGVKLSKTNNPFELKTRENSYFDCQNANSQHICQRNCLYFAYI